VSQALALQEKLAAEFPAVPSYRQGLALSHNNLGILLRDTGRPREAEEAYRRALSLQQELAAGRPAVPDYRRELAGSYYNLGTLLRRTGRPREAEEAYRRALALREKLAADLPAVSAYRLELLASYFSLAALLHKAGRPREAGAAYRQALKHESDDPAIQNRLAWGLATSPAPEPGDARRAVGLAKKAVARAPQNGPFWNTLGVAQYRAGDWPAAVAALEKSMQLQKGGNAGDWFFLAMAHWRSGDGVQARRWYDRAVAWAEKNRPNDEELGQTRAEAAALLGLPGPPATPPAPPTPGGQGGVPPDE
jgi:tetratricopeptide (TPR) repeat protein